MRSRQFAYSVSFNHKIGSPFFGGSFCVDYSCLLSHRHCFPVTKKTLPYWSGNAWAKFSILEELHLCCGNPWSPCSQCCLPPARSQHKPTTKPTTRPLTSPWTATRTVSGVTVAAPRTEIGVSKGYGPSRDYSSFRLQSDGFGMPNLSRMVVTAPVVQAILRAATSSGYFPSNANCFRLHCGR